MSNEKPHDPNSHTAHQEPVSSSVPSPLQDEAAAKAAFQRFMHAPEEPAPPRGWNAWSDSRKNNFLRHTVMPLAFLSAAGFTANAIVEQTDQGSRAHHSAEATSGHAAKAAEVTTGNTKLDATYKEALATDDCETKVSFADMVDVHNQLGQLPEQRSLDNLSLSQYQKATAEAAGAVTESRKKLQFMGLPDNFNDLIEHEMDTSIPLTTYERAITNYLAQFNVEAQFEWAPSQEETDGYIAPVPQNKLENSQEIRTVIVDAMHRFSQLPLSLVNQVGLKKIQFGRILNHAGTDDGKVLGQVIDNKDIMLDVWGLGSSRQHSIFDYNLDLEQEVAAHEFEHNWDYETCFKMLGSFTKDNTFAALMNGFKYGKRAVKTLQRGPEGHFITLEEIPIDPSHYQVAVTEPYGATNTVEAKATMFGQDVFDADATGQLFSTHAKQNKLMNQLVLLLARVNKKDPALGEFYINQIKAARLADAISNRITYIDTTIQKPNGQLSKRTERQIEPYSKLLQELTTAIDGPSALNLKGLDS